MMRADLKSRPLIFVLLFLLVLGWTVGEGLLVPPAISQQTPDEKEQEQRTMMEYLKQKERFSILTRAVHKAGMTTFLEREPALTLLAPTDKAFQKKKGKPYLERIEKNEKANVRSLIRYHLLNAVVDRRWLAGQTDNGGFEPPSQLLFWTLRDRFVRFNVRRDKKRIQFNDTRVKPAPVRVKNGVVFTLHNVLNPDQGQDDQKGLIRVEAPLPAGFPPPGPRRRVVMKSYSEYQTVVTSVEFTPRLFQVILRNVRARDRSRTPLIFQFFRPGTVQTTEIGFVRTLPAKDPQKIEGEELVRVKRNPGSYASFGRLGSGELSKEQRTGLAEKIRSAVQEREEWRVDSKRSGRMIIYNGPRLEAKKRYWELQIPVRKKD